MGDLAISGLPEIRASGPMDPPGTRQHPASRSVGFRRLQRQVRVVPVRRLYSQQIVDEKVVALAVAPWTAPGVALTRQEHEVERLAGIDQSFDYLHGGGRVHVLVQLANREQQPALKL